MTKFPYYYYLILGTVSWPFILMFVAGLGTSENPKRTWLTNLLENILFISSFLVISTLIASAPPLLEPKMDIQKINFDLLLEYADSGLGIVLPYYLILTIMLTPVGYILGAIEKNQAAINKEWKNALSGIQEFLKSKGFTWKIYVLPFLFGSLLSVFLGMLFLYSFLFLPFILSICFAGPFLSGNPAAFCPANYNTFFFVLSKPLMLPIQISNITPALSPVRFSYIYLNVSRFAVDVYNQPSISKIVTLVGAIGTFAAGIDYIFIKIPKWLFSRGQNDGPTSNDTD